MKRLAAQFFLNADLRPDELRTQTAQLCEAGYEILFLHARAGLRTPYLSQDWFDALRIVRDEAVKHGAQVAIWDEDNYPSGTVGNRIRNGWPELTAQFLDFTVLDAQQGVPVEQFFPEDGDLIACFAIGEDGAIRDILGHCGTLKPLQWGDEILAAHAYSQAEPMGFPHRRRSLGDSRWALSWTPDQPCRIVAACIRRCNRAHTSDLMNPETTRLILNLTFEAYLKAYGAESLRNDFAGSFLDEPAPSGEFPWSRVFEDEFKKDHGYDLIPKLPHLVLDLGPESAQVRVAYRKTESRLLCQNYLAQIRSWLNDHGLPSIGHLTRTEWIGLANHHWPWEIRCLGQLDIPCCDPLGFGAGHYGCIAHHIGIKAAVSAARLFNRKAAGADSFAVGGDCVTLQDVKFSADYHLTMGVTFFNVHGLDYTLEGERRDETPPSLSYQHAQWPMMNTLLAYIRKRCNELAGEHVCNLELLMPNTSIAAWHYNPAEPKDQIMHQLAESLLSRQRDFELIDDVTLCEQSPADFARLRPYFIIACASLLPQAAVDFLNAYTAAGGTVMLHGDMPAVLETGKPCQLAATPLDIGAIPAPELKGDGSQCVLIRRIMKDGELKTYLFNRATHEFRGTYDGTPVILAPGEAAFLHELASRPAELPELTPQNWTLQFKDLNSVPLHFWEYDGGRINMINRKHSDETVEQALAHTPGGVLEFRARFFVGDVRQVIFTTEECVLKAGEFAVNGTVIRDFTPSSFRDCRERDCDITALVRRGTEPLMNTITYKGPLFQNMPFLRGAFATAMPMGAPSLPVLTPTLDAFTMDAPRDFLELGYGTYSGLATYTARINAPENGLFRIRLGRVEGAARVYIDGVESDTLIAPPYTVDAELTRGAHTLVINYCNGNGNRDRAAGLPAGILP